MLRYIEGLQLNEEEFSNSGKRKNRCSKKAIDDEPNVHDGLTVDYAKFTKLTKNMLKNAHVVRQKSLKCSPRLSQIISSHGTRSKQLDSRE